MTTYSESNPYRLRFNEDLDDTDRDQLEMVVQGTKAGCVHCDEDGWSLYPDDQTQEEFVKEMEYLEDFNQPRGWLLIEKGSTFIVTPDEDEPEFEEFLGVVVEVKGDHVLMMHLNGNVYEVERRQLNLASDA